MPQDATCPQCKMSFPVTESRNAFTVACPACDAEMTVEFKKPTAPTEAGQPHYDLLVKPGALTALVPPPPKKKKGRDEEDDEPKSKGGSAMIVMFSAGLGMVLVLGGLGLTAWVLFGLIDTTPAVTYNRPNNQFNNNQPNNRPNNQPNNPFIPPKPRDEFELRPVGGTLQPITPPPLTSAVQTITLPAPAGAVSVGGNGRYVVMHLPNTAQLACFDASTGQLTTGSRLTTSGAHLIAAGQNRLAVLAPGGSLQVFELPGLLSRYGSPGPSLPHNTATMAMGSATNGPLLACNPFGEAVLMDIGNDAATPIDGSRGNIGGDMSAPVRAAPGGRLFLRGDFGTGSKTTLVTERGRKWNQLNSELCNGYPSANGQYVLGFGMIVHASTGTSATGARVGGHGNGVWYVPAVSGSHFLRLGETKSAGKQAVSISIHKNYSNPEKEKAVQLGILPETDGLVEWFFGKTVPLDQHLFLIPEARLLVVLNAKKDQLTIRQVDIR